MEKSILRLGLFVLPVGQFWLPLLAALFAVAAARLKCARQRNYLIHVSPFCQDFYLHCRACVSPLSVCVCVCVCVCECRLPQANNVLVTHLYARSSNIWLEQLASITAAENIKYTQH